MEAEKKSRNLIFGTTTTILVALLGVLGWQFIEQKEAAEKAQADLLEFSDLTLRDSLSYEFNILKYEYKTASSQNKKLNNQLQSHKVHIAQLITEIEQLQNSDEDSKIRNAYTKLQSLKEAEASYLSRISTLNRQNRLLLAENKSLKFDLDVEKNYSKTLEDKIEGINLADKPVLRENGLAVHNFSALPVRVNIEGKEQVSTKASKTKKVLVCFTTTKDELVKKGRKTAYFNIYAPDGTLITRNTGSRYKGGSKNYTLKTQFNFENKEKDVCSYWMATEKYLPGNYRSEVIFDSQIIASSTFKLK